MGYPPCSLLFSLQIETNHRVVLSLTCKFNEGTTDDKTSLSCPQTAQLTFLSFLLGMHLPSSVIAENNSCYGLKLPHDR